MELFCTQCRKMDGASIISAPYAGPCLENWVPNLDPVDVKDHFRFHHRMSDTSEMRNCSQAGVISVIRCFSDVREPFEMMFNVHVQSVSG